MKYTTDSDAVTTMSSQLGELTVNGNWNGNNGTVQFYGALADDSTPIGQLIVNGDVTGTTQVAVDNIGGVGAQTLEGIKIITVSGDSPSTGFTQKSRIVAGLYDYTLRQGTASNADTNNWYLTSYLTPTPNPDPTPDPNPTPKPSVRPEPGTYLANAYAANNMFQITLHDRVGELDSVNKMVMCGLVITNVKLMYAIRLVKMKCIKIMMRFN